MLNVYTYTYTIKNNYMYSIIPETATDLTLLSKEFIFIDFSIIICTKLYK